MHDLVGPLVILRASLCPNDGDVVVLGTSLNSFLNFSSREVDWYLLSNDVSNCTNIFGDAMQKM